MYGSSNPSEDSERTAFRRAEKKYKLYYESNSRKKKQAKQVDLTEVLDFMSILESHSNNQELPSGIFALQSDFGRAVFCLENRPGFYFIHGALGVEEQCRWIKESLVSFPQPPNRTNHNALYGPIHDLFVSANQRMVMIEDENLSLGNSDSKEWKFVEEDRASSRAKTGKSVAASNLLRKLRWSTLGLQFDWSKRNYNVSLRHNKIPDELCDLAKAMAAPVMPVGEAFRPEAAIVNYFASGDTLGGHLDDMEADWTKPIVSMSLGCKAIFLLGGKSREDDPVAMFLRSGDVVLMAGEARECFHGVPRIFTDKEHAEIQDLEKRLSEDEDSSIFDYICTSRININIRQVF